MSAADLAGLRQEYMRERLDERDVDPDPIVQFRRWFDDAVKAEVPMVNAMTLATVSAQGQPSARIVLLKGFDEAGFVFFTNYESAKGRQLDQNPRACLLMFWAALERQVRITGTVAKTSAEESETYFHSRPFESQIGAWASAQSHKVDERAVLESRYAELAAKYAGVPVPLPPFWGGYRVAPQSMEFWQGRKSRLHDRLLYVRRDGRWERSRLAP